MIGIPFKEEELDDIMSKGTIVDMSNISFDKDDKYYKKIMLYLRNTYSKNICLDFSKCDYTEKSKIMLEYFLGNIFLYNLEFIKESINILYTYTMRNIIYKDTIFTDDERQLFIKDNIKLVEELYDVIKSTPIIILEDYFLDSKTVLDISALTEKETRLGANLENIIGDKSIELLVIGDSNIKYDYFTNSIFDKDKFIEILKFSLSNYITIMKLITSPESREVLHQLNNTLQKVDKEMIRK